MNKLETRFCEITFKNPFILPSGIITEIPEHDKAEKAGAGGVTIKSITISSRKGYPPPRVIKFGSGFINAVGLKNPGIKKAKRQIEDLMRKSTIPIIVSIFANSDKDFASLASEIISLNPHLIELNLSCPHLTHEFGCPISMATKSVFKIVKSVRSVVDKLPISAKLSPNSLNIRDIAKTAQEAGADAISAINTLGAGMVIDVKTKRPLLGNKLGGISGPAIKPLAIARVYEIYEAVDIPIIGIGGVTTWKDAVEMMMAGASLVGVGSATYLRGYKVFEEIQHGVEIFLKKEGYGNVSQLVGLAH